MPVAKYLEAAFALKLRSSAEGGYEVDFFLERVQIELVPDAELDARAALGLAPIW